jgi:hypothetical protein
VSCELGEAHVLFEAARMHQGNAPGAPTSDDLLKCFVQGVPDLFSGKVTDGISCARRSRELVLDGSYNLELDCDLGPEIFCRLPLSATL